MRRMRWLYANGSCEIRDGLDIRWWNFLQEALPKTAFLPLPNLGPSISDILARGIFSGFILTGGDDWGVFPQRDATEETIFAYARSEGLPVLGVCRGAQIINSLLGGSLARLDGHACTRHIVTGLSGSREVNSYHNFGIDRLGSGLCAVLSDVEDHIEAYRSADGLIHGIIWHPEREAGPDPLDKELFATLFNRTIS